MSQASVVIAEFGVVMIGIGTVGSGMANCLSAALLSREPPVSSERPRTG
jgi:hypothetical protein